MSKPHGLCGTYEWRGKQYIGADSVARAAGVKPNTVIGMLARHGNLDRLGVGSAGASRRIKGKQVQVGPHSFPSQAALARAVGMTESKVSRRIMSGRIDEILAALMAADARRAA